MYGSHLKALELTCSARVVIFNQIQTSKNSPSVQSCTRHHVESGLAPLHMHIQRSHCLHVLLGFLSSHMSLLHDVVNDHVSVEEHVTLRSKVAHDTPSRNVTRGFPLTKAQVTSSRRRHLVASDM